MFLAPRNLEASACPISKTFGESHLYEPSDGHSKMLRAVANLETPAAAIRGSLFAMCPKFPISKASVGNCRKSSQKVLSRLNLAFQEFRKAVMTERETFACLENEYCLWRQSVVFQLLRKAVFIQREIFPSCSIIFCLWRAFKLFRKAVFTQRLRRLRCAFQIFRKKVFPLQLLSRKQWTKHRKPLLNRLWLLLSQTRRERCIGRNKWGRVPISKLSSCRLQGRGGSRRRGKNAEQHRNNSRKAPSSSPPYSSSDAFVVPGLNVFLRGLDGQTRPVAGLTGDSTLSDLNNALILSGQSNSNFILLYRGRLVHNDPRIQLGIFLTTGESGDHLFVQCADELGGGFFDFDLLNTCDHINEETTRERALVLLGGIGRMLKDDAESDIIWKRTLRNLKAFVNLAILILALNFCSRSFHILSNPVLHNLLMDLISQNTELSVNVPME